MIIEFAFKSLGLVGVVLLPFIMLSKEEKLRYGEILRQQVSYCPCR
jgi:hypothetical protein